jgi:type II secretory pathway component PulF
MPNIAEPVTLTFIGVSIALIFVAIGIGIFLVKKFK